VANFFTVKGNGRPVGDGRTMDKVVVQFLGSGDAFSSGCRLQTCILVSGKTNFLIDCGASSLIGINQHGIDPNTISAILLTHLHADHSGGIPFFILDAKFNRKRVRPLTILGPQGTAAWYPRMMEVAFPGSYATERGFPLSVREMTPNEAEALDGLTVVPYTVSHASELQCLALRITCGHNIITYSGDTQWTESLLAASDGADLFIVESYFFDRKANNHLDYQTIKEQLSGMKAKKVILTHMGRDMLENINRCDMETAHDGKRIEIS